MSLNARDKGQRGERKVIDWLQPIVTKLCAELSVPEIIMQRNPAQSDIGGNDIIGIDWLAAEVKNVETDTPGQISSWWEQCTSQARQWSKHGEEPLLPVLFYMRAFRPIRIRMQGAAGLYKQSITCCVDISSQDFEEFFFFKTKRWIMERLAKQPIQHAPARLKPIKPLLPKPNLAVLDKWLL